MAKTSEKMPPCVRQCGPEFGNEIDALMELPCKFLRAVGVCHSDGDLCEKEWVLRPSDYRKAKGRSFRPLTEE
jgi:hypothetical protein